MTDGRTYVLHNSKSGSRFELQHAFSPESLKTEDFTNPGTSVPLVPGSFPELADLLLDANWIVVDHTIPIVRLGSDQGMRQKLEEGLGLELPNNTDILQALLVWISQIKTLEWLAAFGPASMLSSEFGRWTREKLTARFSVRAVIESAGLIRDISSSLRFSFLHLSQTPGPAFMLSIPDVRDSVQDLKKGIQEAKAFLAGGKASQGFAATIDDTKSWATSAYDPALNELEAHLANLGEVKQLSEVCTITRGAHMTMYSRGVEDGIPVVSRVVQLENPEEQELEKVAFAPALERFVLRPGDLVLPAIGRGPQCAMVQSTERLLASDRLFILRVKDPRVSPEYLLEYLTSTLARRLIEGRYASTLPDTTRLDTRGVGSIPVPILEKGTAVDLRQIGALEAELRRTADELNSQRKSLFDAKSAATLHRSVQDLRRKGELLSRSVLRANELQFQVANFYPFPIAWIPLAC